MTDPEFYENKAVVEGLETQYRPDELIFEVANFIQGQVERLLRERMLSLRSFEFKTKPGEGIVIVAREIEANDGAMKKTMGGDGKWPTLVVDFGRGFMGMQEEARTKAFLLLGKQGFIERHGEVFATDLMEMDAWQRLKHNAPMPQGLAARVEAELIGQEVGPARSKAARSL